MECRCVFGSRLFREGVPVGSLCRYRPHGFRLRASVACRRRFGEDFRRSWVYAGRRGGCGSRVSVVRRRGWRLRPSGCKTVVEAELSRLYEGVRSCGGLRGSDPALRGGGIGGLPFRGGMLPGVRAVFCGPVQGGKRREIRGGSSRFAEQSK